MTTMNISLPDPLKALVDAQIASGRYGSVSEYVCELIREDERRKGQERLEGLLAEGLASEETPLTREDFKEIRQEALARAPTRQNET